MTYGTLEIRVSLTHLMRSTALIGHIFSEEPRFKHAPEMPKIDEPNDNINFETESFLSYQDWNLEKPGHAVSCFI